MNKTMKILAIALTLTSLTSVAFGAMLYTLTVPAKATIDTGNWSLFSDSACTIPVSTIDFGTLSQGGNSSVALCIKDTGTDQWLLSNGITSTLPSIDGTVTVTKITSMTGYSFSFPLEFQASQSAMITFTLKASPSAPVSTTPIQFDINIAAYSTGSG